MKWQFGSRAVVARIVDEGCMIRMPFVGQYYGWICKMWYFRQSAFPVADVQFVDEYEQGCTEVIWQCLHLCHKSY